MFRSVRQSGYPLTERAVNFIVKEAAERACINPAASIHRLRHAHASHAIDNGERVSCSLQSCRGHCFPIAAKELLH